jgi:erythromycin esterase
VDMLYEDENAGNSWMFRETVAKYWGTMPHRMILRNQYDGILFVDTVTPVVYVTSGLSAVEPVFPTIDNFRMADQ